MTLPTAETTPSYPASSALPARRALLRRCPPVHAPLSLRALRAALVRATTRPDDATSRLHALLRSRYAADRAVLFGSGTQALSVAIEAAHRADSDHRAVALPAYGCYDIAAAALATGAPLVFYDVDPSTLQPDWDSLDAALARGAGTVVVAPLYGFPVDWERAQEAAGRHGATLIEDAAQGAAGTWRDARIGALGDVSVLSFGRGKGWSGGGGGALLLRNGATASAPAEPQGRAGEARVAALATAQWLLSDPRVYGLPASLPWLHLGETLYKPLERILPLTRFSAALLLETAEDAEREAAARMRTGRALIECLAQSTSMACITPLGAGMPGYLRFPLRIHDAGLREAVLRDYGAAGAAAGYPGVVAELPEVKASTLASPDPFTGARTLVRELITLPTHSRSDATAWNRLLANGR